MYLKKEEREFLAALLEHYCDWAVFQHHSLRREPKEPRILRYTTIDRMEQLRRKLLGMEHKPTRVQNGEEWNGVPRVPRPVEEDWLKDWL